MEIRFTKMNGAGNDFIVIDNRSKSITLNHQSIAGFCDRHRGIGADGLLAVEPAEGKADFRMRYYNSDGGEAEMCGNGARCFARFAARLLPTPPTSLSFETPAGLIVAEFDGDLVTLEMGEPRDYKAVQTLNLDGQHYDVHFLNTGVPHAVAFVEDVEKVAIRAHGAALRYHEAFSPKGTNANFAQVTEPNRLILRTYERGVEDETLACGTGVCATALLHALVAKVSSPIHVQVRGGDTLMVSFKKTGPSAFEDVRLTGPADFVFEGSISL
jgi:diaminopimelate epimerase